MKPIQIFMRGLLMGISDVIPGVSGGTIAFITGIYERLVRAVHHVDITFAKLLLSARFKQAYQRVDGTFLAFLLLGIGLAILSMSHLITFLLESYGIAVWSFFGGLIAASGVMMLAKERSKKPVHYLLMLLGMIASLVLSFASAGVGSTHPLALFFSGMIAICAMVLPGISGSFILVLLGQYQTIIEAVKTFDITTISIFGVGALIGIILFIRILHWLLTSYRAGTIYVLIGVMLGALAKVWPWKIALQEVATTSGKTVVLQEQWVLPSNYVGDPQIVMSVLMFALGALIVWSISKIEEPSKV